MGFVPYHDVHDDREVARVVLAGERLPQPEKCPDQMYEIMQSCWMMAPKDRPSMTEVHTRLQGSFAGAMLEVSKTECVICLNAEPVMALFPCGHRCACEQCSSLLNGEPCPICRSVCTAVQRIFD